MVPVATILKIVLALINAAKAVTAYMHDRQMIAAGQAQAVADAMTQAAADVMRARRAGDDADAKAGGDPSKVDPNVFEKDP